jgi:hypothetical protein
MGGVRRFANAMDSDDEQVLAFLMDEEEAVDADATDDSGGEDDHTMILSALLALIIEDARPLGRGGSRPGRRKSKARQRMEGYCMLYADYFTDDVIFRRRYRMCRGGNTADAWGRLKLGPDGRWRIRGGMMQ